MFNIDLFIVWCTSSEFGLCRNLQPILT